MHAIPYQTARPHVRSGDLIAFESKSLIGRLIRSWTGSRYAHVGVAMWLVAGGAEPRLFLLESREGVGVTLRLLSQAGPCWFIPTMIDWNTEVNRFVWPNLGTAKYDWGSIWRRITFRQPKRNSVYYCSEFAGEVLMRGGFPVDVAAFKDPGELVQSVLRNGRGQIHWLAPKAIEATRRSLARPSSVIAQPAE